MPLTTFPQNKPEYRLTPAGLETCSQSIDVDRWLQLDLEQEAELEKIFTSARPAAPLNELRTECKSNKPRR
jgi:hypothetical protein